MHALKSAITIKFKPPPPSNPTQTMGFEVDGGLEFTKSLSYHRLQSKSVSLWASLYIIINETGFFVATKWVFVVQKCNIDLTSTPELGVCEFHR